jgi:hypothetical protein
LGTRLALKEGTSELYLMTVVFEIETSQRE